MPISSRYEPLSAGPTSTKIACATSRTQKLIRLTLRTWTFATGAIGTLTNATVVEIAGLPNPAPGYATIACDLDAGRVIGIAEGRTGASLIACLGRFSINEMQAVEAIAMDMSGAYLSQMRAILDAPEQKIVFDRFHIVAHMNDAVDKTRRRENKLLRAPCRCRAAAP